VLGYGGLYTADHNEVSDTIIVSTQYVGNAGFLGLIPRIVAPPTSSTALPAMIDVMRQWMSARVVGRLGLIRKTATLDWFRSEITQVLCGQSWAQLEKTLGSPHWTLEGLIALRTQYGRFTSFFYLLDRDYAKMQSGLKGGMAWFAEKASRYEVCRKRELCEAALRAVSDPPSMIKKYGTNLAPVLEELKANSELVRGARFLFLKSTLNPTDSSAGYVTRWSW
jgi:hypothetical protein